MPIYPTIASVVFSIFTASRDVRVKDVDYWRGRPIGLYNKDHNHEETAISLMALDNGGHISIKNKTGEKVFPVRESGTV